MISQQTRFDYVRDEIKFGQNEKRQFNFGNEIDFKFTINFKYH